MTDFMLPDIGEGLTEAELVSWSVGVGDTVAVNDVLCEVETAKAVVELPSPFAGVVAGLHVAPGETVPVGTALISVSETGGAVEGAVAGAADGAAEEATDETDETAEPESAPAVLVGSGPRAPVARRLHLRPRPDHTGRAAADRLRATP
ncbi:biotin/lipoyl-containing protein, partial [Pseudonocardia pini]|uniref:biotin/lipoyl-containing protein n=1 Tax=Pseudonocardia pini TaxID=2758030 RepID=UPI0028AFB7FE